MANFVLSGDPAPAKPCYCIPVFWYVVLPDVSLLAAVGRFLDDFWRMRFCYLHVYPGFLALCTSCDLLIKSICAAILYVSPVNGVLLDPFWLLFCRFLWKKWFFLLAKLHVYPSIQGLAAESADLPDSADPSPKARLKPYFSRACPQDDVSSTRQTPSNYYYYYYYYY